MTLPLRLAAQVFNTPLLLTPHAAGLLASNLAARFAGEPASAPEAAGLPGRPRRAAAAGSSGYQLQDGLARIPILGELVNRAASLAAAAGFTSYESIGAQLRAAVADPGVRAILLEIDSPGGEASGAMEAGALVREAANAKPVVAFVNGLAGSAAYAIASGASNIVVTPSSSLGSIGVVLLHLDRSEAIARAGLKPTLISAGAHKTDGTSLHALAPDARARIQASIDELYDLFVKTVASHRGLTEAVVRATEAGLFMGARAVSVGLADETGDFKTAMALTTSTRRAAPRAIAAPARAPAPKTAAADRALAATGLSPAADALRAVRLAERARLQAIITGPEAQGCPDFARHLACETDLDVKTALALIAVAPKAVPGSGSARGRIVGQRSIAEERDRQVAAAKAASWAPIVDEPNGAAGRSSPGFVAPPTANSSPKTGANSPRPNFVR
ncbi:peptidase S49 [Methylocella silvestris BL2]|uniref:Peptidase S49 n=1 Tax=Methylocella silvestris (strain DSM 15510 / CIP 108128 / LMG 27833 / NCIMB 13906 / BL2) TaxID=395965 RepID=B8EI14_METSB|nr:S49 family peptidase [Methylocella silvestris]ACK50496.1 peptidase S49 [Methylocella silvestris BL2]